MECTDIDYLIEETDLCTVCTLIPLKRFSAAYFIEGTYELVAFYILRFHILAFMPYRISLFIIYIKSQRKSEVR